MVNKDSTVFGVKNCLIQREVMEVPLRNSIGEFRAAAFEIYAYGSIREYVAVYRGIPCSEQIVVPVRINSACLTGELFDESRCDCRWQLEQALSYIATNKIGIVIYHPEHEGRGAGLVTKLESFKLMDLGLTTSQAFRELGINVDSRTYWASTVILKRFGIKRIKLLTNNPKKVRAVEEAGIIVEEVIPLVMNTDDVNIKRYLNSKRDEMGHWI